MSDGIVFVLHGGADQKYAAGLAAALAPEAAFATQLQAPGTRAVQFGAGVVCVVVWRRELQTEIAAVTAALAHAKANSVVCRLGGAPLPAELAALPMVDAQGDAAADAARLRGAIARVRQSIAERGARAAPKLDAPGAMVGAAKQPFAVRSAYGLAATLAVVGVVAPSIVERAQATGAEPGSVGPADAMQTAEAPTATLVSAAPADVAAPLTSTPALERWVAETPDIEIAAPAAQAAEPDIAADAVAAAPETALMVEVAFAASEHEPAIAPDPKRATWRSQLAKPVAVAASLSAAKPAATDAAPESGD